VKEKDLYFETIDKNFERWMSSYDVAQRIGLIKTWIPSEARMLSCLEVGCGTGRISEAIFDLVGELTVADISEDLARKVGERLGVGWKEQDACNLQIPENTFDLVISSECIEHTPDPRRALKEMVRVIKPGGTIIVTSPNKAWYPLLWLSMVAKVRKFAGIENWLFPWEAKRVLEENGMCRMMLGGCHLLPWQIPLVKCVLPLFDRYGSFLYPIMINYGVRGTKR
jgi:ubiquinone/menaquinone biosynthesis C-methylase UbiE